MYVTISADKYTSFNIIKLEVLFLEVTHMKYGHILFLRNFSILNRSSGSWNFSMNKKFLCVNLPEGTFKWERALAKGVSATLSWINVIHFTSIFVKLKNEIITIHIFTNYYIKFFRNLRKFTCTNVIPVGHLQIKKFCSQINPWTSI